MIRNPTPALHFLAARSRWLFATAFAVGLSVSGVTLLGQDIVTTTPQESAVPAALKQVQDAENPIVSQATPANLPDSPLVMSGPFTVRAHLAYRLEYADGLPDPSGQDRSTSIQNLSTDIFVDLGRHWVFDYLPTLVYYGNSAFTNSVDQSLRLNGWASYEDWTLQMSNSYSSTTSPNVQIGEQARQITWTNSIGALYSINSALGLELGLSHSYQSAEEFASSHEYATADWLHYKAAPRLDTSVGLAYGYVDMSTGTDNTYVRPQIRLTWSVLSKISLSAHAGEETRHFRDGVAANANNPIYGASLQWQPIETTRITIGADRLVATTYFAGVIMKTNQWNAGLEQRLLQHFYFSASIAQQKNDYVIPAGVLVSVRNDDTYSYDFRVSTDLFGRATAAVFLQDTHNSSDLSQFALSSRQYGLEVGYRF
ncbi:MAG TPA: outer membrane beta-barrel protein [Candidatus Didemnitutus sp.]